MSSIDPSDGDDDNSMKTLAVVTIGVVLATAMAAPTADKGSFICDIVSNGWRSGTQKSRCKYRNDQIQ